MSLLKSHLWPACRLPYPHPRPQTSTNVSADIAPLAALPPHPPPGPGPGPGHHDHPRLWLLGALSSQKVRLSLCSAADCAKHIELTIRRAAHAALRGVLDPEECLRNALPRARACVPHGATPDPLERLVKTVLSLEFWRGWGRTPSNPPRCASSPQRRVRSPRMSSKCITARASMRPPQGHPGSTGKAGKNNAFPRVLEGLGAKTLKSAALL